jgi:hypothetical protein
LGDIQRGLLPVAEESFGFEIVGSSTPDPAVVTVCTGGSVGGLD